MITPEKQWGIVIIIPDNCSFANVLIRNSLTLITRSDITEFYSKATHVNSGFWCTNQQENFPDQNQYVFV
jgi:hypothetical protein